MCAKMNKKPYDKGRIDVIVRKRPLNDNELNRGDRDIVSCSVNSAIIEELKYRIDGTAYVEQHEFRVDRFYDENANNEQIYREYVKPLVEYAFKENKTCSCFTYGQTGSGKTYTMIGSRNTKTRQQQQNFIPGIYEYAANDIYKMLSLPEYNGKIEILISFYEIYCGKLYDLLQNRKLLEALDNGRREVIIKDLAIRSIKCKEDLIRHMLEGLNLRRIGQNSQNDQSSRSHALLRIELKDMENSNKARGRIVFIDLAGSERGADSMNQSKQIQIDGAGINRSLLALKECIRAMDLDKLHIPFRNSELTKVLRDIFIGGSRNLMIANICPSNLSCEQTLNTLRYASKVKNFKSINCNPLLNPRIGSTPANKRCDSSFINKCTLKQSVTTRVDKVIDDEEDEEGKEGTDDVDMDDESASEYAEFDTFVPQNITCNINTTPLASSLPCSRLKTCGEITMSDVMLMGKISDRIDHIENCLKSQNSNIVQTVESILNTMELDSEVGLIFQSLVDTDVPNDDVLLKLYCNKGADEFTKDDYLHIVELNNNAKYVLLKASELHDQISQLLTLQQSDQDDYIQHVRNKLIMELKPLLFLKQSLDRFIITDRLLNYAKTLIVE